MLYYLDTMIVIYAVEGAAAYQQRALNHLAALEQGGHRFAISELTRTECLVPVLGVGAASDFRTSSVSSTDPTCGRCP